MKKVVIIGAGAAGMMAAVSAARFGHKVVIVEKNEKAGKKLFITGKGRCNVTNDSDEEAMLRQVVTNAKFLYSAFYTFNSASAMDFFESQGVDLKVERGQRVFPVSDKSSDIINALLRCLKSLGVRILYKCTVDSLIVDEEGVKGVRYYDHIKMNELYADAVIIATGGVSYASTGSTGDGYKLAASVGHKITDIMPALVPLTVKESFCKEMMGLSLKNVNAGFYFGKKLLYEDFGEMLFTHFGVSGPLILSGSSYVNGKLCQGKELKLVIDLKPALSYEQLDARILRDFQNNMNKQFRNVLSGLLPAKMIPVMIEMSGIDPYKQVNEVSKEERQRLCDLMKGFTMTVTGTRDFNEAIITHGGVHVREVNPSTMESKFCKNLFFAGEVLDLDALTGGFNLQIAWSTGWLAGMSIEEEEDGI